MARSNEPASATAEFFINLADNDSLDPKPGAAPNTTGYAVFGKAVEGMSVVDQIAKVPLNGGKGPFPDADPALPVTIEKVTIVDAAKPVTLRILIVGGYGTFGGRLVKLLAGDARATILVAGRSIEKAREFCAAASASAELIPVAFDCAR